MTILLVEDNPADVVMIRELLSDQKGSPFDIVCADRFSAAKPYFSDAGIDIILLDLGLPDSQGLDTLRRVREHAGEVPIVVLTMLDNEETGLVALKEGAQDYLVKGQMNGPLIVRSLRYAIERGRIEKELKKHHDYLEELVTDRTTQLAEVNKELRQQYSVLAKKDEVIQVLNRNLEERVEERTRELQKSNKELKNAKEELHKQLDDLAERDKLLAESEERFRISAQCVSDVIWDWNISDGQVEWYGQIDAMLGYTPGEFPRTQDAWEKIIHPDDRDRVMSMRDRHVKTQTPYAAEYRVIRKDGKIHYWADKGTAMLDEKGRTYRMVGSCSDITKRRLAEEALHRKNEELDGYFTNTLDLLCIADADGHFRRLNREWESSLGYTPAELEGKWFLDFVHPDDMEASLNAMAELRAGKLVLQFSNRYRHRDGSYRWIEWRLFPAGDLFYASARDITERKKMTDLIEESLAEKETLLREIHHRVKNNLQLISGLLDMTRMRSSDESTKSILTDIMLKIQTMAQIHTRLYESKHIGKISITDQCRDQVTALSNIYSHKGHEISCEINPEEVCLPVDQALPCALVVNEILSNAYKHAFKGRKQGKIVISAYEENGRIRIMVRDNGIGLPDDFDINRSNSLGLKLIRTLVQHQLKGTLAVKCRNGTEISMEFPVITVGMQK